MQLERVRANGPVIFGADVLPANQSPEIIEVFKEDIPENTRVLRGVDKNEVRVLSNVTVREGAVSEQRFDVDAVRTRSRAGNRVSKGLAIYKVNKVPQVEEIETLTRDYVREQAPQAYIKNANVLAKYPLVRGVKEFGEITPVDRDWETLFTL